MGCPGGAHPAFTLRSLSNFYIFLKINELRYFSRFCFLFFIFYFSDFQIVMVYFDVLRFVYLVFLFLYRFLLYCANARNMPFLLILLLPV